MRVIPKDKVIFYYDAENKANYEVENGEIFWVEVDDCYSGQITDESILRTDIDISIMDCAVGPIDVKGAKKGDTLCVEVLAIDFAPQGVMVTKCGLGVLGDKIDRPTTKIVPIHDGFAHFTDDIKFPLTPMIGVMGVSPAEGRIHCAVPADNGGNMDTKLVKVGSKIYFPVFQDGAGLAVGDMHACMGDGELDGTGIETAGRMCLKVTVYKDRPVERPVIETDEALYFLASRPTMDECIKVASDDAVKYIMKKFGLEFQNAYRLLTAVCDVQISELVDDNLTVRVRLPKFDDRVRTL